MTSYELDQLIIKYINGDSSCFDLIYLETKQSVYLSIRMIINRNEVIEDLMQDTYMKALDNLLSYKIGTNFKAWISRIARNLTINYYNHFKKEEIIEIDSTVFNQESKESLLTYYLNVLNQEERSIVIYHLICNMRFIEISKICDKPLSTVYLIYKKALKKITDLV